jgi:hypothetical protein
MFGIKRRLFISYFCCDDEGHFFLGNTSKFKATKVTPDFIEYVEIKLKDSLKVKALTIVNWKYY